MNSFKGYFPTYIALFLVFLSFSVTGQKGVEIGARAGLSHYFGDLNPTYKMSDPGMVLGLKFRRNFNERLCLSSGFDFGVISGSDSDSYNSFERKRNLDFKSNVFDANFTLEFNFFPYIHGTADNYYTPYLFGGFSILKFNPTTNYDGKTYSLRDIRTEGQDYSLVSGAWVYGMGFKWDLSRDFSINIELSGRSVFSDYIDDVQNSYVSKSDPVISAIANRSGDSNFGAVGTQRGDGLSNDSVYFLSIGIMRYFGKLHCPAITRDLY